MFNCKLEMENGKFRNCVGILIAFRLRNISHTKYISHRRYIARQYIAPKGHIGSSLVVILESDRTMFYHPCFDFVGIGRGTATAVVGSSLAVILQWDRTMLI